MVEAFDHLVRVGKVLYVGITGMPFWQFATAYLHAERRGLARFVAVQNHYYLLWREDERELLPFCRAQGIGLIPYSPMARGFLCDCADARITGSASASISLRASKYGCGNRRGGPLDCRSVPAGTAAGAAPSLFFPCISSHRNLLSVATISNSAIGGAARLQQQQQQQRQPS